MSKTVKPTHVFSFNYKRSFYFVFALLTIMSLLSVLALKEVMLQQSQIATSPIEPSLLFVQTAQTGTITMAMYEDEKIYSLTLNQVDGELQFFSDRPNRINGSIKQSEFLDSWIKNDDDFLSDPPNAEIIATSNSNAPQHFTVMLTHPVYDEKAATVKYEVTPLAGQTLIEGKYTNLSLFINNIETEPQDIYSITSSDGHTVITTALHPVPTGNTIKMARDLQPGDPILSHMGNTTVKEIQAKGIRPPLFNMEIINERFANQPAPQPFSANGILVN